MFHLHSLGQCMITLGATRIVPTAKLMFASALYVAIEGARPIARETMASLFWPEENEETASHSLRQALYRLRAQGVPINGDSERIHVPDGIVTTDFAPLLASDASVPVGEMLDRIPGGFLPGYFPSISGPFAEWVESQRERVNAVLRRQLVSGITTLRAAGDWPATQALAQRCLELDPLNEEATLALAEAMAMDGSKARAIMMIERYMNEVGPRSKELFLPAITLKKRISELYPLPPVIEREPPHTGREGEMETLDAALKDARQGRGSAFLISGPPGMGKTRLVTEFTRAAQLQGIATARSQMGRHDDHRPLGAWSDLVPTLQRMPGALGADPESLPYLKRLTTYDATQSAPSAETLDAEYLFARMRMSIIDLVSAVAAERVVILLIEDVHWMDEWSWDVMTALTKKLEKLGILILMTRRDSEEPSTPLPSDALLRDLVLAPLDETRCKKLLGLLGLAPSRVTDLEFAEWCVKTSLGNPYFLLELARRASHSEKGFFAPPSLTRLIGERFSDITPLSRRVLQAAAILGRRATFARLERVLNESRVAIFDSLDELARHSLILLRESGIECIHDLLGISALSYSSAVSVRALRMHVAEDMERDAIASTDPSFLWDAAEHLREAGESLRAVRILDRCARQASATGAALEAARALSRAVELLPSGALRDELQGRRMQALHAAGEFSELREVSKAFLDRSPIESDRHSLEELLALDAQLECEGPSMDLFSRLRECATSQSSTPSHRVKSASIALKVAHLLGAAEEALNLYRRIAPDLNSNANIDHGLVRMIYEGSFGSAMESEKEAIRVIAHLREQEINPASRARILLICATAFAMNGNCADGAHVLDEAMGLAVELQLPRVSRWARQKKLDFAIYFDDLDEATALLSTMTEAETLSEYRDRATTRNKVRLALRRGDFATAKAFLERLESVIPLYGPSERIFHAEIATRVRLRTESWVPDESYMHELLRLFRHCAARAFGSDLFLVALFEALEARGEHQLMASVLQEHIRLHGPSNGVRAVELQECVRRLGLQT